MTLLSWFTERSKTFNYGRGIPGGNTRLYTIRYKHCVDPESVLHPSDSRCLLGLPFPGNHDVTCHLLLWSREKLPNLE